MRILFVTHQYMKKGKPEAGTPQYLHRLSLILLALGHTPIIITSGEENGHSFEDGLEVWTVKTAVKCKKLFKGENFAHLKMGFLMNLKIREIVKKEQVDLIQFTSIGGLALFYYGRTPAVMRLSSYAKTYFSSLQTYDAKTLRGKARLERVSARNCDMIFAPCRVTAEAFAKDCGRKVYVVETPFVNDVKEMNYRYVEQHLKGKKYVLFFGTLYPEKGILVIAQILREFLKKNTDYYFVFIGEARTINGKDVRKMIRKAAGEFFNRVIISKPLLHDELYPVIERADFIVLPSLMDNFPNACIESLYFSKIVIGTDGASFEQIIDDGYNGFLCKIGDSEDLLRKMQKVVELDECERQRLEKNAHNSTIRLQPEYAVKRLLKLYQYVIKNKHYIVK